MTVEYNGEAEFPPVEQGTSEMLGLLAAIIVLLIVFRTFTAMLIPIALAISALVTAFLLLYILAGLTDINTITPILVSMIGLGVGIDYSLFIVTRFDSCSMKGSRHGMRLPKRAHPPAAPCCSPASPVAISVTGLAFIGLDFVTKLGIGSALGVLTTVLIANSLLLAVLALLGHKVDRLKVPFLPPDRRFRGGSREDARRPLGPVRDRQRAVGLPRRARADPRAGRDVPARAARRRRPGHAAHGADQPPGL